MQRVAGAGGVAAQQTARPDVTGGGDVDDERSRRAGDVAAHDGGLPAVGFLAHTEHEPFEVGQGQRRRQHQRQQQPRRTRAHGGEIAEVHCHGAAADGVRGEEACVDVHAVDEGVGGLHEQLTAWGAQHGGVVADADHHVRSAGREAAAQPRDQLVFAALADGHRSLGGRR